MRNRSLALASVLAMSAVETEGFTAGGSAPPPAPKPAELKNSHWCVHPKHGLGMIGEIGSQVSFHRFKTPPGGESAELESTPVPVELGELRLCAADELPPHLGYTTQQLKDFGYAR